MFRNLEARSGGWTTCNQGLFLYAILYTWSVFSVTVTEPCLQMNYHIRAQLSCHLSKNDHCIFVIMPVLCADKPITTVSMTQIVHLILPNNRMFCFLKLRLLGRTRCYAALYPFPLKHPCLELFKKFQKITDERCYALDPAFVIVCLLVMF